ncbi:hypothetical protein HHK36_010836 [Tetracentron sinense]|uniref:Uncharacterized protein n=1 Tax=Tetracentron sinense TaxID=13715 RepID=A0A834ZB21_TETSI|nr:hypothetical protein HHK36_010836 [Tetracentron sinense]
MAREVGPILGSSEPLPAGPDLLLSSQRLSECSTSTSSDQLLIVTLPSQSSSSKALGGTPPPRAFALYSHHTTISKKPLLSLTRSLEPSEKIEIEEGPLGFDKRMGKLRGFALFVYKNVEAAKASLVDPTKTIDGHQLVCKLTIEGKKKTFGVLDR